MRKFLATISVFFAGAAVLPAQALIAPWTNVQFTDSTGKPLSGGAVYTCTAGSSCPGSQQATFTSSSAFTQNQNPVRLDSAGRASIWLTAGLAYRFVVVDFAGNVIPGAGGDNIMGAATGSSGGGGGGGGGSCLTGGADTDVQFNQLGSCSGSANLTWNYNTQILTVTGKAGTPAVVAAGGYIQSQGGFLSSTLAGSWQGFNSPTDGALLRGMSIAQNASNTKGGYLDFAPITYNPNGGGSCVDVDGNAVQQPLPLNGLSAFGTNDVILWNGTSPLIPASGCGAALPVTTDYGVNTNGYLLAMGGLASSNLAYNSINTIYTGGGHPSGGVEAGALIAGTLYPTGTVTTSTTLVSAAYLGGYVQVGHSATPPATGTISTVTNPLVQGDGLVQGTLYWDDALHCFNGYTDGSTWACLSTVGGAGAGTVNSGTQFQIAYYPATAAAVSGNAALLFNPATPQISFAGTYQTNGLTYGFNASTCTSTNCIQAVSGGLAGKWVTTTDSHFWTEEAAPALSAAGQCKVYDDSTLHNLLLSCNAGAFAVFGGGGGSGTVSSGQQYQMAYYPGSGTTTTVAGNAALLFNPATPQISFAGTYQTNGTTYGFNASTCTLANCIQTSSGGLSGKWSTVSDSTFWLEEAAPSISAAGQCRAYDDSSFHALFLSCNGQPYLSIGGGSGTVSASSQFFIAYYPANGTTVNGNTGFEYSPTAGQVSLAGFFQASGSTGGFTAPTNTAFNTVQAVNGGMLARSFTSQKYVQIGNNNGPPTLAPGDSTNPGLLYWDTGLGVARIWNGSAYSSLATGGIPTLNTLSGALSVTCNAATSCSINASGSTIQITAPQPLGTGSAVTFGSVTSPGVHQSTVTAGSGLGFQIANGLGTPFSVNGNGAVSTAGAVTSSVGFNSTNTAANSVQTAGQVNACNSGGCSGGSAYAVNGSTVINSVGQFIGAAVLATGNIQTGGVFAVAGGFFGSSATVVIGSCTLSFQGGILYSHSGC